MTRAWRTLDDGRIEIDGVVPVLAGPSAEHFRARVCGRWSGLAELAGREHQVPPAWILGMIWAESGGNEHARSSDGGLGLMQLTHPSTFAGHSPDEAMDPALNVRLGARAIATYARTPRAADLPAVASRYNAGGRADGSPHPSNASPWGYRETPGHIDRVVAATNTAIAWCLAAVKGGLGGAGNAEPDPAKMLGLLTAALWWLA